MNKRFALALCGLSSLCTAEVQAFSDWDSFRIPAAAGGGGERYFTGVPTDGYTCEVCHASETRVPIEITGLPLDGYEPGTPYFVEVRWPAGTPPRVALAAEVITPTGVERDSPSLSKPPSISAMDDERCQGLADEPLAVDMIEGTERNILRVDPCGSMVARFGFTAPDAPRAYFGLGGVVSDNSETPEGEAVFDYHVQLRRVGEPAPAADGCAVSTGSARAGLAWSFALALGLVAWCRRRSPRKPLA